MMRDPSGSIRQHISSVASFGAVYTSVIVAAELRFGAAKRSSAKLSSKLDQVLKTMLVEPFVPGMDEVYGRLRAALERAGTPIGANDLWIAAQALHDGSVLVTDNVREFGRVPNLNVENWLR